MGGNSHTVETSPEVEGEIGHFGLEAWWFATFSRSERVYIEKTYQHPGLLTVARPLTTGSGPSVYESAPALLTAVANQLSTCAQERDMALRLLTKAEERAQTESDALALHLAYDGMIRLHDRWKEQYPDALDAVFAACFKQVRIAEQVARRLHSRYPMRPLPTHIGYEMMVTMLVDVENYDRAIDACRQARLEGWPGDWTARIQQLAKDSGSPVRYISSSGMTQI